MNDIDWMLMRMSDTPVRWWWTAERKRHFYLMFKLMHLLTMCDAMSSQAKRRIVMAIREMWGENQNYGKTLEHINYSRVSTVQSIAAYRREVGEDPRRGGGR